MATRVEPGYTGEEGRFTTLRSALALPLEGVNGLVGVLHSTAWSKTLSAQITAHSPSHQFQAGALGGERRQVSAGRRFSHDGLLMDCRTRGRYSFTG